MLKNNKYEILTPVGWVDFEGIQYTGKKNIIEVKTETKTVRSSYDHEFFNSKHEHTKAKDLSINDEIITADGYEKIVEINELDIENDCYDIIEVNNDTNSFWVNEGIETANCDELAFVRKNIAQKFWTSIYPTISCLAADTLILTPDGFDRIESYFQGYKEGDYFEIKNLEIWGKNGFESVSHGYISPASETYRVYLENGQYVEVTPEHPLYAEPCNNSPYHLNSQLTHNHNPQMIQSQDLIVGDQLRIDKGMNIQGSLNVSKKRFLNNFNHDPYKYVNVSLESLNEIIDYTGYSIPYDGQRSLNVLLQILNNYGYEYSISEYSVRIQRYIAKYRQEWIPIKFIEKHLKARTYDFTVPRTHTFLQNGILGSNTGGKCIITTTPTTDDTLFANMWKLANKTVDDYGNETDIGINGFKAYEVKWDAHPERDESYKIDQVRQFGEEFFMREHELQFISEEETLVNPIKLAQIETKEPIEKSKGEIRWFKRLSKDYIYIIGYDPSLGTGGDYAGIEIYEFPTMEQVGEWMHNRSDVPEQLNVLRRILDMFRDAGFDEDNVRWTLENNTVGEAPLVLIDEYGEDNFFGYFMVEPFNPLKKGQRKRFRKGYNTNKDSKYTGCMRLKSWIENDRMKINSKPLQEQLQHFVRRGNTYAASTGDHDDLVMSTLLVVRMAMEIMKEEDEFMEKLGYSGGDGDDEEGDDYIPPLPVY